MRVLEWLVILGREAAVSRRMRALLVLASLATPAVGQGRDVKGRWVPIDGGALILVLLGDGSGATLPPFPDFDVSYRMAGGWLNLGITGSTGETPFAAVFHADTLVVGSREPQKRVRLRAAAATESPIEGSWVLLPPTEELDVLTFRSDGRAVHEWNMPSDLVADPDGGFRAIERLEVHGDTLVAIDGERSSRYELRTHGDTLDLSVQGRLVYRALRRPFGCFGATEVDRNASECRAESP